MSNYTCVKCGCEDIIPSAPCPTSVGCPTPSKCDETFSAECVVYTGSNLLCNNQTVVTNGITVAAALTNIVDLICSIKTEPVVEISTPSENQLTATVSGGNPPYQYLWSIEQGIFAGHTITGGNTLVSITLDPIIGNTLKVGGIGITTGALYMSHVKLVVTDAFGTAVTRYYNYASLL